MRAAPAVTRIARMRIQRMIAPETRRSTQVAMWSVIQPRRWKKKAGRPRHATPSHKQRAIGASQGLAEVVVLITDRTTTSLFKPAKVRSEERRVGKEGNAQW